MHTVSSLSSRITTTGGILLLKNGDGVHPPVVIGRDEKWKPIKGFPMYGISSHGRVFSKNRILKNIFCVDGYYSINLSKKSKQYRHRISRLVALHFISNPFNKKFVNHLDGNKCNNHISNLEWCTSKENDAHARRTGLKKWGGNLARPKLNTSQIKQIRILGKKISQRKLGKRFNVSHTTIGDILNGIAWKNI